jgi:hypothetical protein
MTWLTDALACIISGRAKGQELHMLLPCAWAPINLSETALVQTPILSAMWNDIGQRIQRAANLQIRIEAQFAPKPPCEGTPLLQRHRAWC